MARRDRRRRAQGGPRQRRRRHPRRDRRGARVQRRGLREVVHPEGRPVTPGRPPTPACRPPTCSPACRRSATSWPARRPTCCPAPACRCHRAASADLAPHGTTIVAATFAGGVIMAGDRRATMGNVIAQRDIEKVFPADEYSARRHRRHRRASPSRWSGCSRPSSSTTRRSRAHAVARRQGQPALRADPRQPRRWRCRAWPSSRCSPATTSTRRPGPDLQLRRHRRPLRGDRVPLGGLRARCSPAAR